MKLGPLVQILLVLFAISCTQPSKRVLIDVAHGERFWHDPTDMVGMDSDFVDRVKYMTAEITRSATSAGAEIGYIKNEIKGEDLRPTDLLFIHIPSSKFTPTEVTAVVQHVESDGGLFIVVDEDYWATLEQVNANDIVAKFGITFGVNNPDTTVGGKSLAGSVTKSEWKIPYHGARLVTGGAPFSTGTYGERSVFGVYQEFGKGRVVAMGDGMVSLYMTEWEDVKDYQCQAFMSDVFRWLLRE